LATFEQWMGLISTSLADDLRHPRTERRRKTTLMRMLATLSSPDEGSATVMGHDLLASPHEVRATIALTGQFASSTRI
jgi:hypothetical protein